MPKLIRLALIISTSLFLSACNNFKPYEIPIQQGTQLQQSQVDQLKPGMTQDQVEYILGTPNLKDPYHPNNWYYIYTMQQNYEPMQEQKLIVYFNNNDQVTKVTGDFKIPQGLN